MLIDFSFCIYVIHVETRRNAIPGQVLVLVWKWSRGLKEENFAQMKVILITLVAQILSLPAGEGIFKGLIQTTKATKPISRTSTNSISRDITSFDSSISRTTAKTGLNQRFKNLIGKGKSPVAREANLPKNEVKPLTPSQKQDLSFQKLLFPPIADDLPGLKKQFDSLNFLSKSGATKSQQGLVNARLKELNDLILKKEAEKSASWFWS